MNMKTFISNYVEAHPNCSFEVAQAAYERAVEAEEHDIISQPLREEYEHSKARVMRAMSMAQAMKEAINARIEAQKNYVDRFVIMGDKKQEATNQLKSNNSAILG